MNPALTVKRLVAGGLAVATIERRAGFSRGKLARLVDGNTVLTPQERERLEDFAAEILPKGSMAAPHHERCPPRFGR